MTATEGESGNMGGFKVMVEHADGNTVISATNPNIESMIGTAPQMICVPRHMAVAQGECAYPHSVSRLHQMV